MDYHLDRRLRLLTDPEHKSLYSWAILEVDDEGRVIEQRDQIPWVWTLYWTATELVLSDQLDVREGWEKEEGRLAQDDEVRHRRAIRAKLRPGDVRGDRNYFRRTTFRMFGTDRELKEFELRIETLPNETDKEVCHAWGMVSYTSTNDFHPERENDLLQFTLQVKPTTFERYAKRIADGAADEVIFGASMVSGFYSEWSPDIFTRDVKILTAGSEHKVELPVGIKFDPPRLGRVGEIHLHINGVRQQPDLGKTDDEDDVDDTPTPALVRPGVETKVVADPEVAKHLASLRKSALWIIGLLVVIAFIMASKS